MNNFWLACLVVSTAAGAFVAKPMGVIAVCVAIVAALVWRNALLVVIAAFVIASATSHLWWTRLDAPRPNEVSGLATLVSDPQRKFQTLQAEVDLHHRRYLLQGNVANISQLSTLQAGDHIELHGRGESLSGKTVAHFRRRHVCGRINADRVEFVDHGNVIARSTNALRSLLARGASLLPQQQGALLLGLTIGDDRAIDSSVVTQFRDSGIAHLTAVSGANVAFVLLLAAPLLSRLRLRARFFVAVGVLVFFGFVTRWEPSVLRAEAMAGVVLYGNLIGRFVALFRAVCIGVTGALLVDPFLVGSIGFLLSSCACFGMATLGAFLAAYLPGPRSAVRAFSYMAGAQVGVLPVQLLVFGPPPAMSPVANLVAGPLSGVVLIAGLPAAAIAGITGAPVGEWFLLPARVAIIGLQKIAAWFS